MAPRAESLAQRRHRLVARSATLRDALNTDWQAIAPVFTAANQVQDVWLWLRTQPLAALLPLVAVGALAALRKPARLVTWPLRVWSLWRWWQRVAPRWRSIR